MSCCLPHCCTGCWEDAHQEQIACKAQIHRKEACSSGPVPKLYHDADDSDDSNDDAKCIGHLGEWIFASSLLLPCLSEDTSSTISTCLAEAFKANSEANAPHLLFWTIWRSSWMSSLRSPWTSCLNTSNGIMLLNWFLEKNLPVVKSIHWHLLNKRNWMHS